MRNWQFIGRLWLLSWLRATAVHTYLRVGGPAGCPPMQPDPRTRLERTVSNFSEICGARRNAGSIPRSRCAARNDAMAKDRVCTVSRNHELDDQMGYLQNRLEDTDILQAYFLPAVTLVVRGRAARHRNARERKSAQCDDSWS